MMNYSQCIFNQIVQGNRVSNSLAYAAPSANSIYALTQSRKQHGEVSRRVTDQFCLRGLRTYLALG